MPPKVSLNHPKGLFYLSAAEMWERFSFYGMRALLTLYMVDSLFAYKGDKEAEDIAYSIYAAYGALVYGTPLIGGYIADKYLGRRKSVMLGAVLMALGHFFMAVEIPVFFYGALGLLIVGNGFFKPNISTIVGGLYAYDDVRRESGFTIFYMGINFGAMLAPLICGWLGEVYGWHYGFGAAGIGMLIGLVIFYAGIKQNVYGEENGSQPDTYKHKQWGILRFNHILYVAGFMLLIPFSFLVYRYEYMNYLAWVILFAVLIYLAIIMQASSKVERERLIVIVILAFFITVFWSFFEQAGSSLTVFAKKRVDLTYLNAAQTNSINPFYIVVFAIPFSLIWTYLGQIRMNPYTPVKFGLGILQLGLGFFVFAMSGYFMDGNAKVPFFFLALGYLLITTGELFISPIGLSKVTELAPKKIVGFMMGVWFLASFFAHHIAGFIARFTVSADEATGNSQRGIWGQLISFTTGFGMDDLKGAGDAAQSLIQYTAVFAQIGMVAVIVSLFAFILTPILKKWMHGVH